MQGLDFGSPAGSLGLPPYGAGQKLGLKLKSEGSHGLLFKSVRDLAAKRNNCAAVFSPKF
ncbi:MAG TPA: hypothetical protein VFW62_01040 [bacterium]|nr:hypothetical protein [bacterium]